MSPAVSLLVLVTVAAAEPVEAEAGARACVAFAGDVMLGRDLGPALAARPSILEALPAVPLIANLEGAVAAAPGSCSKQPRLCLDVDRAALKSVAPRLLAVSTENNHAGDWGEPGRTATRELLASHGVAAVAAAAPVIVPLGARRLGLAALDLSAGTPEVLARRLEQARLYVAWLRVRVGLVAVLLHAGDELVAAPTQLQEHTARVLRAWGAQLVVGGHTHVVQPMRCQAGGAVAFGLGNLLFDQEPASTHRGALLTCCVDGAAWECRDERVERAAVDPLALTRSPGAFTCTGELAAQLPDGLAARVEVERLALALPFPAAGPGAFFALRRRVEPFDGEDALRPTVFAVRGERAVALWRGTALAWPLVAATVLDGERGLICAIHRGDDFLRLDPENVGRRRVAYRWSGFGFDRASDLPVQAACEAL